MIISRRSCLNTISGAALAGLAHSLSAQSAPSAYTDAEKEKFLKTATIISAKEIGHGVTHPVKVEMKLGTVLHSAQIQRVSKELPDFFPDGGKPVPMFDSWKYNVAAYKVDRLLGLNMVVVSVPRPYQGKPAGFSWWVDNVQFEESERLNKGIEAPDKESFEQQWALTKVFDELILNIDRNLANLLITKSWTLALIDHSRSFAAAPVIRNKANLTRCSRSLMSAMKSLTIASVTSAMQGLLSSAEVAALVARSAKIVDFFEAEAKSKGEGNVLFS